MSAPFEMLPRYFIREWLASLIDRHGSHAHREGCTLYSLASYLGVTRDSLRQLATRDTAGIGVDRQRLLSKIITLVENGNLVFETVDGKKVGRLVDKPKPICRYRVEFGTGRPVVKLVGRPKEFVPPRSFKSLVLK